MYRKLIFSLILLGNTIGLQAFNLTEKIDQFSQIGFYMGHTIQGIIDYFSIDSIIKECPEVGPHTQQFVKDVFTIYYPEIDTKKVHILFSQQGQVPVVLNKSGEFYVIVPIVDRTLLWALNAYLAKNGRSIITIPDNYQFTDDGLALYYNEDSLGTLGQARNWSKEFAKEVLHLRFQYIDEVLFPIHVGLLIHEGAHIFHNDFYNRLVYCSIPALVHIAGLTGWEMSKGYVPQEYKAERVLTKVIARQGALCLSFLVGKMIQGTYQRQYVESSADQESADRIDSQIIAHALAEFFKGFSQRIPTKFSRIDSSLGTHPASEKRSELFAECARTIQDSEDNKFEQLIELTCDQFRNIAVDPA